MVPGVRRCSVTRGLSWRNASLPWCFYMHAKSLDAGSFTIPSQGFPHQGTRVFLKTSTVLLLPCFELVV